MKILVTGGAGFIGSNLIDKLLSLNHEVTCLDNFSTGKINNVKEYLLNKNFTLIKGDIRDLDTCKMAVKNTEYVFHEAALGSVPRSIKDPLTTNNVNVTGFLNMLIASKDEGVKRFIYAASSSTYGDSCELPKIEDNIGKPLSPYAITKYINELYAEIFFKIYGLNTIGLRYFNVFGKRQDPNSEYAAVIPLFIKKLINHESPIINGDGEISRDFTYIDNVIQMNLLAMNTNNPKAINTVYNTAFGERNTLNQLINYLKKYLNEFDKSISSVDIKYGPKREGDIKHSLASIEKAKINLGYEPKFNLEKGLKEIIKWYWENERNK